MSVAWQKQVLNEAFKRFQPLPELAEASSIRAVELIEEGEGLGGRELTPATRINESQLKHRCTAHGFSNRVGPAA